MSTANKNVHHAVASLNLPASATALVTYAEGIVKAMTGNPAFPSPVPALAAITTAANELHAAQTVALTRAKGAASVRDEKHTVLVQLLQQERAYIQAQADANPENSASIIQSAGVGLRKSVTRRARGFVAKQGALSGTAEVVAATAGKRAAYEWQSSVDGGKTWTALPPTLQAKTTVTGLQAGTAVQFRYRAVTKGGAGDWSAAVALNVQ